MLFNQNYSYVVPYIHKLFVWLKENLYLCVIVDMLSIMYLTDSSRGLKSVCKFKICKNFAKILHRRKFLLRILQLFCNFFATFLQLFCNFFAIFLQFFCKFFAKNVQKFFQKKKRTRGHESIIQQPLLEVTRKWIPFVLIPNQFTKILKKNCKKIAKKLQKNCKKVAKKLQKSCKKVAKILQKNLQNFCRFFAEFLQLHILQKVLHFRPREESVSYLWYEFFKKFMNRKISEYHQTASK